MLIRIRCRDGNFRFDVQPTSDVSELIGKILDTVKADPKTITFSNQPRGGEVKVSTLKGRTLQNLGLKHGDLVFVGYQSPEEAAASSDTKPTVPSQVTFSGDSDRAHRPWENVQEDAVDTYWRKQEGKIPRGRDTRFCKHGVNAMCDYCMPLEPYDAQYHAQHSIKHLSYHAYLRKLSPKLSLSISAPSNAALDIPPLEPLSYKVKNPCPNGKHAPWPGGICSSCQPSAITLQPQSFRMVDHLEFSSQSLVDRFLQAWRRTGTQRFGWLLGRYEPYDKVPMGIKAVVEAIHEPPQEGELDGLSLGLPWEDEARVRDLAASSSPPMTIVGYIFTDLDPSEEDRTKNVYKRHPGSYFLSSLEVFFAARLQLQSPVPSRSSTTGFFSSRLVTAVATATEEGSVDIAAYQVSEQACAMVDADMIEASVDPGIMRVKEEDRSDTNPRYVPDVFFRYKNEYGLDVQKSAKPCFPVEYLLVNVTHGFPQNPTPLFLSNNFSIENRAGFEDQTVEAVIRSLSKLDAPDLTDPADSTMHNKNPQKLQELVDYISDWHLITFLGTTQLISDNDMKTLVKAASSGHSSESTLLEDLFKTDSWQTLMTLTRVNSAAHEKGAGASASRASHFPIMDENEDELPADIREQIARMEAGDHDPTALDSVRNQTSQGPNGGSGVGAATGVKICPHCTFENTHGGSDCEVCGLPLS